MHSPPEMSTLNCGDENGSQLSSCNPDLKASGRGGFITLLSFPRAIVHIDCDAFFTSCESARQPRLKGKPVVTGQERGIVSCQVMRQRQQASNAACLLAKREGYALA